MNLKKIVYSMAVGLGLAAGTMGMVSANSGGIQGASGFGTNGGTVAGIDGIANIGESASDNLVTSAKRFVNWLLGLLAFIAFLMLLVGGFQMVTAGGEEDGYKKGFTYVKNAAIGLAFIGLSWLIVSVIFWVINLATTTSGT